MLTARELRKKYHNDNFDEDLESIKKRVSEEIEKAAQNNKENVVIEVPERYMDMIGEWIDEHGYGVNTYGKEHLFIYWDKEYLDLLETE